MSAKANKRKSAASKGVNRTGPAMRGMAAKHRNCNAMGTLPSERWVISEAAANLAIECAIDAAESLKVPMNIAIVDPSGYLVAFRRMDNAMPGSIEIAIKKARTVTLFNGSMTTESMQPMCLPGGNVWGFEQTNGGLVVFGGGLPLKLLAGNLSVRLVFLGDQRNKISRLPKVELWAIRHTMVSRYPDVKPISNLYQKCYLLYSMSTYVGLNTDSSL